MRLSVPGFFTLLVILLVTRALTRLVAHFFQTVGAGRIRPPWLDAETAEATRRIVVGVRHGGPPRLALDQDPQRAQRGGHAAERRGDHGADGQLHPARRPRRRARQRDRHDRLRRALAAGARPARARRAAGLRETPAPYVVQRALSDFYVEYQLVAHAERSDERPLALSRLHAEIQDAFNEHGVQIMSPHFLGQPGAPVLVPRERWNAPPAASG